MSDVQEPLPEVEGDVLEFNGDEKNPEWAEADTPSGAVVLEDKAAEEPSHEERLHRLMQRGVIDPLILLKLRLDVVTDFLVDPRWVPLLDKSYDDSLEAFLQNAEEAANRAELLRK